MTEQAKDELLSAIPLHEREARRNGTPTLGSGKIYDVPEDLFLVDDFPIPAHWWQSYGLDVGWNRTAAIWVAEDRDADIAYFTGEHYAAEQTPAIHAESIKARGAWIPGAIDPAARGRAQTDGERLIELYEAAGLRLTPADNSVEAGIFEVRQRLLGGKLKVFKSCTNWLAEYRLYRRDEKGKVVKVRDHAQDAGRYAIMTGLEIARQGGPPKQFRGGRGRIFAG